MIDLDDYMDNQMEILEAQKTITNLNMLFEQFKKAISNKENLCSVKLNWLLTDEQLQMLSDRGIYMIEHYPLNSSCYKFRI